MMDAEKLAMQRRIDTLDQYATRLHAALTEAERENARLKAELETVMRTLEEEKANHQHTFECAQQFEKEWERTKRYRNSAVADPQERRDCVDCKNHYKLPTEEPCRSCGIGQRNWEYRWLNKKNGGAEE